MKSRSPIPVSTAWSCVLLVVAGVHMVWQRLRR